MTTALRLLLAVFATYRLASMVSSEEGPYVGWPKDERQTGIFEAIRLQTGGYDYGPDGRPERNLGRGITCPLCTGVYLAFVLVCGAVLLPSRIGDAFLAWMGVSGAQVFLENLTSDEAIQDAIEDVADNLEG